MYNYYFNDEISVESVNALIELIQDKEKINLWFSTDGGCSDSMTYLISVLNSFGENITVTLIGQVHSAGTELLVSYKGNLVISDGIDYMIFHKEDRKLHTLRNHGYDAKILAQICEENNKNFAKKLKEKGILTDKQIKQFNKGEDVYLYKHDILKLKL